MTTNYTQKSEKYISIPGYENLYSVTKCGIVKNDRTGKIIGSKNTSYTVVSLYKNGEKNHTYSHRIVAELFVPNPENKPHVNHKDGDKKNNHYSNLEWCTAKENISHSIYQGTFHINGSNNRYTTHDANNIKFNINDKKIKTMNSEYSFKKGFGQVPLGKVKEIKTDLMTALGINNRGSWYRRLKGEISPRMSEVKLIEEVFQRYGIKEIWGE